MMVIYDRIQCEQTAQVNAIPSPAYDRTYCMQTARVDAIPSPGPEVILSLKNAISYW